MPQQMIWFFLSIAFSLVVWGVITARYILPKLHELPPVDALRPILMLHSFRFIGLAFLVPGVVSADLPSAFSHQAAYGDVMAAALALITLLLLPSAAGVASTWIFNTLGLVDLLNAFYQANRGGLLAGQLGAAYFLPTLIVPFLLITHLLVFRLLVQHQRELWSARPTVRVGLGR